MPHISWLADAARATGYPVTEVAGWQTRGSTDQNGRPLSFNPRGLVWHHTAGGAVGDMPTLNTLINGRAGLPGPLSQYGLGRSGRIYVVAAGRANHAGAGGWNGLVGNSSVIGIEAEHVGSATVPWPEVQLDAYRRLSAQILTRLGTTTDFMSGHKEWAPTRKVDPISLDMNVERARVAALMEQGDDDMWQYLNVDETLVRHAWDEGWLQPKTTATLNYFLSLLPELQKAQSSNPDWLNFRRAVTNGIARQKAVVNAPVPPSSLSEAQVKAIVNQHIVGTSVSLRPPA